MQETDEIELFTLYGSAASDSMFDFPSHFFRLPSCTGIIPYRIDFKCAITFGDPLCPPDELTKLTDAFHKFCRESHLNVIYINASEKFSKLAQEYCPILIEACEELIFNPQMDSILKSHKLENKVDRTKQDLTFHEYIPFDEEIEKSLLEVGKKWQKAKKGPSLYLGHLDFFKNPKGKRWFYVKKGEQIVSMAMLSQLDAHKGWLLKFFFTLPHTSRGTSEFLMISLLKTLKKENCHFLTKGLLPVDSISKIKGYGYPSSLLIKYIFKMISLVFRFKKRKQYWRKYHYKKAISYILFSNSKIGINEIRALTKAIKMDY